MRVAVVGSGPAGVAAAKALLDRGVAVDMLDFGNEIENSVEDLASRLRSENPSTEDLAQLRPPRATKGFAHTITTLFASLWRQTRALDLMEKTRLGSPFTYRDIDWGIPLSGALAARSLAKGGMSNIWGAACYPLSKEDYTDWPVQEDEMALHYRVVARLLSLIEPGDDLDTVYPIYGSNSEGLPLNPPAAILLEHWRQHRDCLADHCILFGRARLAVRAKDRTEGPGCQLCGLCLYGCPYDTIYRSDWTLSTLHQYPSFRYLKSLLVKSYLEEGNRILVEVVGKGQRLPKRLKYDALFLAAGTLSSLRIAIESQERYNRSVRLIDNDVYLVPFLRATKGGGPPALLHFTLNELVLRVSIWGYPIHVQFYCMSDQIIDRFRPLLSGLPRPLREWMDTLLGRFFLAFIYLPGKASADIQATVKPGTPVGTVFINQSRKADSRKIVRQLIRYFARRHSALGLYPLGPAISSTPEGPTGGHLVSGLPMRDRPGPLETFPDGRLHDTDRVYVVDGAALPSLPAQNSTYTIMANAHRIGTIFAERQGSQLNIKWDSGKMAFPYRQHKAISPDSNTKARFSKSSIHPNVATLDHNQIQYKGFFLTNAYHRMVLRTAVRIARLQPGMHVLDYGCSHQQLRKALPPGVRYTGYDIQAELSDTDDPRGEFYDLVFAIQVLFYMDGPGLHEWVETFFTATKDLVVMTPSRNFIKESILDRAFGLKKYRDNFARSLPTEIYDRLSRRFSLLSMKNLFWMGELTRWQRQ